MSSAPRFRRTPWVLGSVALGLVVLAGCAARQPADTKASAPATAESTEPPKVPPPPSSPLSKVRTGMTDLDVRKILGEPSYVNSYATGKQWIPFCYGSDTSRSAWTYAGQGQVVFSRNRYSGDLNVVDVNYDPSLR